MRPTLLLLAALSLVGPSAVLASGSSSTNGPKVPMVSDHDNHHYYTIHFRDLAVTSPQEIASNLGVTYVGQVGELENYHLFSYPKTMMEKRFLATGGASSLTNGTTQNDLIVQRFNHLKRSDAFSPWLKKRGVSDTALLGQAQPLQQQEQGQTGQSRRKRAQDPHPLGSIEKQVLRRRIKRVMPLEKRDEYIHGETQPHDGVAAQFGIADPGFTYQWHLHNTREPRNDINVTGVWQTGITGKGAIVAIIDDGLDYQSEDLAPNFHAVGSYDFNDHRALPTPTLDDDNHGTRCAGEIASVRNDLCGVGVAWDAKVAGLRILSGEITDVDEAAALNFNFQETQIYSCSWGPSDDGIAMDGPNQLLRDAFINGVNNGRGGKGSIFVFATGNGGRNGDNCNFDGYTNSRYTISIGAISRQNAHPAYSEACSAQLAVTYSSGVDSYIYTCDVGKRNCFNQHSGTSAAAPIAAGIYALVLEVNPDLSWRDVQHLTVRTAVPVDENDADWTETSAGYLYNHKYGYGSMDAFAIVELAKTWELVGPQANYESPVIEVNGNIPVGEAGLMSIAEVTQKEMDDLGFKRLEHVTVTVKIDHTIRGEVAIDLKSPDNIISNLAVARPLDESPDGFQDWTFMSVKHWEENPVGAWTLIVYDRVNPNNTGVLVSWTLGLHGEQKTVNDDGTPFPLPSNEPPAQPSSTSGNDPLPTDTPPNDNHQAPPPAPNGGHQPTQPSGADKSAAPVTGPSGIPQPEGAGEVSGINPFIYVMFSGMFVAIGGALFLTYRKRQSSNRALYGASIEDEEAGQRGGLLGRRGDYEFDELATHDLENSDDEDDDDDMEDSRMHGEGKDGRRIVFDRSNIVDSDGEETAPFHKKGQTGSGGALAGVAASASAGGKSSKGKGRDVSSPMSSGEDVLDVTDSSFEVEGEKDYSDDEDDDDERLDLRDAQSRSRSIKSESWDDFNTLVKTTEDS